jgi:hypothetical protein
VGLSEGGLLRESITTDMMYKCLPGPCDCMSLACMTLWCTCAAAAGTDRVFACALACSLLLVLGDACIVCAPGTCWQPWLAKQMGEVNLLVHTPFILAYKELTSAESQAASVQ